MNTGLLQVGDIIEIVEGDEVHTDFPERIGFDGHQWNISDTCVTIGGNYDVSTDYLKGKYIVYEGARVSGDEDGGDGYRIHCRKLNDKEEMDKVNVIEIYFYQVGSFYGMMPDKKAISHVEVAIDSITIKYPCEKIKGYDDNEN